MRSIDDLSRNEIENLISQWVFNERNRKILHRRLIDGVRFDKLAEEFDVFCISPAILYDDRGMARYDAESLRSAIEKRPRSPVTSEESSSCRSMGRYHRF